MRDVMTQHQIFTATELVPLLRERGIDLSASQVHRLVSGTPERLLLQVMAALCDILSCTPADLVTTTAENAGVRKTATDHLLAPPANVSKRALGAAIRQQLPEPPGAVVADALGYHDKTTSRLIRESGGAWSRYAPGDHARSPTGWLPRGASNS
ncbi:helix-turn-helix domain-containing protein [Streptomyces gelaticus]|uniref:helix-turn-helix domain-containing protein n=1 Tax=Streptomyces gelaticus TaxID=285446 RepID=UPI0037AF322D